MTADVLLDDIVERSSRRYMVTKVLNLWEVSMGGSHRFMHRYALYSLLATGPEQKQLQKQLQIDKKENREATRFHINPNALKTEVLKPPLIQRNLYYLSDSANCHFMKHQFRLSRMTFQIMIKTESSRGTVVPSLGQQVWHSSSGNTFYTWQEFIHYMTKKLQQFLNVTFTLKANTIDLTSSLPQKHVMWFAMAEEPIHVYHHLGMDVCVCSVCVFSVST
jgi:hypothetical protein